MPKKDVYESPLIQRYASDEMAELFGARHRILTWRQLWLALAEAQRRIGLRITTRQLSQLKRTIDEIDFKAAARYEKIVPNMRSCQDTASSVTVLPWARRSTSTRARRRRELARSVW